MALDIAMGGSTNTVLHILAAAHEGEIDFTMDDIDRLSRRCPAFRRSRPPRPTCTWKTCTAPAASWRSSANSNRAGLINADLPTVHEKTLGDALSKWDIAVTDNPAALELFSAAPGGVPTQVAFSQSARWKELDLDREKGVIRDAQHPFSKDGGLAVLKGNIAARRLHREDRRRR